MTLLVAAVAAWIAWGMDPLSVVVVSGLAALTWSLFAAAFWPFTPCPAPFCEKGKVRRPGKRKTWRRCGWCGGSGARLRWGRRVYDALRPAKHGRR